jgi:MFS family permease
MVIASPFIGLIYDMIGRRMTVIISYILIATGLVFVPISAPNIFFVSLSRGCMGVGIQIQISNPMINDYVVKETRGKAFLLNGMGYVLGETFAMAILFNLTRNLDPKFSFALVAAVIGGLGILVLFVIVEADSLKTRYKKWKLEYT